MLKETIVTVCLKESTVIKDFEKKRVKAFLTQFKTRFVFQILYRNAVQYLQYLKYIDKASSRIERDLHKSMKNKELIQLLKLEKSLVYFSTSLKSNEVVLEKLLKHDGIKKYLDDTELLEDVIIENKQAIEKCPIYSSILTGIMDAYTSVISNNVSIVMKFLASVTIVMVIPDHGGKLLRHECKINTARAVRQQARLRYSACVSHCVVSNLRTYTSEEKDALS